MGRWNYEVDRIWQKVIKQNGRLIRFNVKNKNLKKSFYLTNQMKLLDHQLIFALGFN